MNKDTKKQLDEALNKEFSEKTSIENYGIPAEAVSLARQLVKVAEDLTTVMADHDFSRMHEDLTDPYDTIKFVLVNECLIDSVKAIRELGAVLEMTKEEIDSTAEKRGMNVRALMSIVLVSSLNNALGDK